ncbi:L-seryl-tRNA(Sec) kinase [Falco biarmicus]|uniref:L-seryl-tRNA(Sec) kinase n=1 Tax=Falco biarmicus TaxID=345155 RepID=UPI00247A12D7|nr:L-seryl-tRNA(Sec) kinase isoform X2 [Falco cherrug]XP_055657907.1 L-seryl-tRNA(Sec) kinase isoform X2 [Falco peregrinus]XP_056207454.1 L-seryl-tRNA(Sec) kinase [Falco biarmicus]
MQYLAHYPINRRVRPAVPAPPRPARRPRACAERRQSRTATGPVAALAAAAERRGGGGRARVGLCVLGGLPAAGKSTLGRALRRRLPQRRGWACALLAYDELIPPEAFRPREPGAGPLPPCWKRSRRELLQCLERVLRALLGEDPQAAPAPPAAWHRLLACCQRQGLLCPPEGQAGPGPCWAPPGTSRPLYLILDDNFYYQSMRYEVYQLARKYSLSFCQLFLECPLECCLQRNCLRSRPVPDQTIYLMARKIEMPDPKKNAWEQNSLILKSLDGAPEDDEQIISLLATALENPVKQNEEDTEQKEADRAICAASAVHQADQTCRRIISQAMKDAKDKNILPSEMKSLAEELNKLKAELLEDLRQGNNLKKQICIQNQYSDPAASFISAFQHGASNVVNKYILK